MHWKVELQDILPVTGGGLRRRLSNSRLSLAPSVYSGISGVGGDDGGKRQRFVKTGFYRGAVVALKQVNGNCLLSRNLLLELKRMKDLHHDHLCRFIGACLEPENPLLITEYCPRGSLQDILEEDELALDNNFRFSLINDVVRGMTFIHSSDIRTHGNLKSSNCVVDSRWVVKISDFGLNKFKAKQVVTSLWLEDSFDKAELCDIEYFHRPLPKAVAHLEGESWLLNGNFVVRPLELGFVFSKLRKLIQRFMKIKYFLKVTPTI